MLCKEVFLNKTSTLPKVTVDVNKQLGLNVKS